MGFGAVEAMVVSEELGRGLVNAPFAQGALIAPTLLSAAPADVQPQWLPKIADGSALVVLAHQERAARYRLHHVDDPRQRERRRLDASTARKSVVPAGDEADAFIVPARIAGADDAAEGIALLLVEKSAPGVSVRGYPTQDGARAAELS